MGSECRMFMLSYTLYSMYILAGVPGVAQVYINIFNIYSRHLLALSFMILAKVAALSVKF